jgi:hypothetical protein
MEWGTLPQWITALIAACALAAAVISIKSQREIARKRAATDFFVKTEMDRDTLASHKKFLDAMETLQRFLVAGKSYDDFSRDDAYLHLRDYLNLQELMAVGILNEVFDEDVCYFFWSGEMERTYRRTKKFVLYVQALPGEQDTYVELVKVAKRWMKRDGASEAD